MESFDSLLTCCICLDRYRNPKLLPCQHSFCMEPCMERLIDYVKRQVKCPECRAEHRIPYKGIQDYPNNVTLQRFLDMYHVISGELPDPNQGQIMERCSVCNEKDYLQHCSHCEKKVCPECKNAHVDILKRELARINSQVRRSIHRLYDVLQNLNKSSSTVKQNCVSVLEEVEHIGQRLTKAIKDRTDFLKTEVENHMDTEVHNIDTLRTNLEQEIANIESNSELVEKHMQDSVVWDDCELMDAKDIFLKTVEFVRNFEHDQSNGGEWRKPIRFSVIQDPNSLSRTLEHFGELNIAKKEMSDSCNGLPIVGGSTAGAPGALMRSKSDHRLVAQMRHQEDRAYGGYCEDSGRFSPMARRRFGERLPRKETEPSSYGEDSCTFESPSERRHKYRSRYTRRNLEIDDEMDAYRPEIHVNVHESNPVKEKKDREKVIDTDDATRGPLSGITRIADVPRVIRKFAETERVPKKTAEPPKQVDTTPKSTQPPSAPWRRQKSDDDDITRIKKQNRESEHRLNSTAEEETPTPARSSAVNSSSVELTSNVSSAQSKNRLSRDESSSETEDSQRRRSRVNHPVTDSPALQASAQSLSERRLSTSDSALPKKATHDSETAVGRTAVSRSSSTASVGPSATRSASISDTWQRHISRSTSTDSAASDSSSSNSKPKTGAIYSTSELRRRFQQDSQTGSSAETGRSRVGSNSTANGRHSVSTASSVNGNDTLSTSATAGMRPRFQSRFLGRASTPKTNASKESESSDDTTSESEPDSSSDSGTDDHLVSARDSKITRPTNPSSSSTAGTGIGSLLARSAHARSSATESNSSSGTPPSAAAGNGVVPTRRPSSFTSYMSRRESDLPSQSNYLDRYGSSRYDGSSYDNKPYESRYSSRYGDYGVSNALARSRTSSHLETRSSAANSEEPYSFTSKYQRSSRAAPEDYSTSSRYSNYSSRFLNRSKSSAALEETEAAGTTEDSTSVTAAVAESVPIHGGGTNDGGKSRYVAPVDNRPWLARSRSSEVAETDSSVARAAASGLATESAGNADSHTSGAAANSHLRVDSTQLSSRQQQDRQQQRSTGESVSSSEAQTTGGSSKSEALSSWAQYLKNKYSYRNKEDKDKGKTSKLADIDGSKRFSTSKQGSVDALRRSQDSTSMMFSSKAQSAYLQAGKLKFQVGSRGNGPGCFEWPRGVAVGPDGSIVVADSSNHRVQVFDSTGHFVKEFGQYGNGEAEFDCLAGVCVNRIGQYIISDRYNHRIQLFDPCGRYLGSFGQNGTTPGRFNYPWGVTTDALGFIYVCDKENHRVQVFQSDGTFVGFFGGEGVSSGQMLHPHYIAVSATNRVVVTDSNNHRVQVFDINGKCLTTFGGEGCEEGKFKFPRGVAVDDDGYIVVCDSGNNRIQIFSADGSFLKSFGNWGSEGGQFKGLEGAAVMPDGSILVSDRENHRIQVF